MDEMVDAEALRRGVRERYRDVARGLILVSSPIQLS